MKINSIIAQLKTGVLQMFSANVLNKVIVMVSNMIITRVLTRYEYGVWSYALNIYGYLELISGFGLLSGAYQFATENHGTEKEYQYFKYCIKYGLIIDAIIIGVCTAVFSVISFSIPESRYFTIALSPLLLFSFLMSILMQVFLSENRISEYARILNINTVLNATCTCTGAIFGITGVLVGRYIAVLFSVIQIVLKLRYEIASIIRARLFKLSEVKPLWRYSLFTGASSALNCLLYLIDITMVGTLIADAEEVALYKVASLIPTALTFIPSSVITAYLPRIIYNRKDKAWVNRNVRKLYLGVGSINLAICSVLIIFAPIVITIVSGTKYLSAVSIFRILILGYCISGTFRSLSTNILASFKRVKYNFLLSVVSGTSDILLNCYLIHKFHTIGAAYATLGVEIISSVMGFSYLFYIVYKRGNYYVESND